MARLSAVLLLTTFAVSSFNFGRATGKACSALMASSPSGTPSTGTGTSALVAGGAHTLQPNYAVSATNLRHWEKQTLTVYVAPSLDDNKTAAQVNKLLGRSLNLWNSKIGEAVKLVPTTDKDADICLSFVQPGTLSGGAIGRTDVMFRLNDQVLTHANVRLNLGLSPEEFVQVAAHELGHALGIQGHSEDPHDLMYAYAHVPAQITDRDLNTMSVSYAAVLRSNANAHLARAENNSAEIELTVETVSGH